MQRRNLSMIAAMAPNRGIGFENDLPWKCKEDMSWFKEFTTGKNVVMGYKTFESLGCKPLPNRKNYVLTNRVVKGYNNINLEFVKFTQLLRMMNYWESEDFVVIGGSQIYELFSPYVSEAYITEINKNIIGEEQQFDTFLIEMPEHLNKAEVIKEYDNCIVRRYFKGASS